jgi:hypothetical protein
MHDTQWVIIIHELHEEIMKHVFTEDARKY